MGAMKFKSTVTAFAVLVTISLLLPQDLSAQQVGEPAESDRAAELLMQLRDADEAEAARLERELQLEWSKSGSAAMDFLLKRGRDALEVSDTHAAIEHFTALTDHAPEFAEGWQGLARAYYAEDLYGPAADALEHVLALNPAHFGALRGLGAIFEQTERPALAHQVHERVLELRPHDPEVTEAMQRLAAQIDGTAL